MFQQRFHLKVGEGRTTLSVDTILSELLAIRLGETPGTAAADAAVRAWLQNTFDAHLQRKHKVKQSASQWLRRYLILALVDKSLSDAWGESEWQRHA